MDYCVAHELNDFVFSNFLLSPSIISTVKWIVYPIMHHSSRHITSHIMAYFFIYNLSNLSQGAIFAKFFHFHFAEACVGQHCSGVLSQLRRCRAVGGRSFRKLQRWSHQLGRRLVTSKKPGSNLETMEKIDCTFWKKKKAPSLWLASQSPSLSLAKCELKKEASIHELSG